MDQDKAPQWFHRHEDDDTRRFKELAESLARLEARMDPGSDTYVLAPLLPYMQGAAGLGIIWKILVAVGGAALIYFQIKAALAGAPDVLK